MHISQRPQEKVPSSARRRKSSAKPKQTTSSTALPENAIPLQLESKSNESKKQKESESRSRHTANVENNESPNQIVNTSDTATSVSKLISNIKDNRINEDTNKLEHQKNDMTNNEISSRNIEKSEQTTTETPKSETEDNDVRCAYIK